MLTVTNLKMSTSDRLCVICCKSHIININIGCAVLTAAILYETKRPSKSW